MYFSAIPNTLTVLLLVALHGQQAHSSDDKAKPADPCTVASSTGAFYDLRPLTILPLVDGKKPGKNEKIDSWHARGYDYKSNFTLNVCAPVVEELKDVVGIKKDLWQNVSAYYESGSDVYSLGQMSSNLTLRGRRLVLQYINGSPCGPEKEKRLVDDGEEKPKFRRRRKSATISFHCDKDPLATASLATFVGVDPDECSYVFEVLSREACIGSEPAKQGAGPAAVFVIIGFIAVLVYFIGGVFYQRNVSNARGWRQLPNYTMWAGIGSFIKDIFIALTSSCGQLVPRSRGYSAVSGGANGYSNSRGRNRQAEENNLIDSLDEEWE